MIDGFGLLILKFQTLNNRLVYTYTWINVLVKYALNIKN